MMILTVILAAGGLDDAKAALGKLEAPQPVQGELKVMRWQRVEGESDKPKESSAGVTFHVGESPGGVSMQCTRGMLTEKAQPIVGSVTLMRVHHLLDAKAELLHQLEGATVLSETETTWKEQSARLLKLKVDNLDSQKGVKAAERAGVSVDMSNGTAMLWLDAQGLPLAGEISGDVAAGVLMLKVKSHNRVRREYAIVGNRLVVTREEEENDTDALGHGLQVRQTTELAVEERQ